MTKEIFKKTVPGPVEDETGPSKQSPDEQFVKNLIKPAFNNPGQEKFKELTNLGWTTLPLDWLQNHWMADPDDFDWEKASQTIKQIQERGLEVAVMKDNQRGYQILYRESH